MNGCFWRHGNLFIRPDFLQQNAIPFTVCIQNPGDVVLIGGSTLYQSYDEGINIILSIPYLDQNAHSTIIANGLVFSETCGCPAASSRDRVVEKRVRVLYLRPVIDGTSDPIQTGIDSDPPLTDVVDSEDRAVVVPEVPLTPSIALDGPCAEDVDMLMEPDGAIVLQGGYIYAFKFTSEHR